MRKFYNGLTNHKRPNPETESFGKFLEWEPNDFPSFTTAEKNFVTVFKKYGRDFSKALVIPGSSVTEADEIQMYSRMQRGPCHNIAEFFLRAVHGRLDDVSLWWGFVDNYFGEKYVGMIFHSFLIFSNFNQIRVWDPLLIKHNLEHRPITFRSHFGINLPIEYLDHIKPCTLPADYNYSGYIKECVFPDDQKSGELVAFLDQYSKSP